MPNRSEKNHDLKAKIIAKAWKDPHFKERLLKNPKAAFKEVGLDISKDIQVKVIEDKPNSFTFVLPAPVAQVDSLSEQELIKLAAAGVKTGSCNCSQSIFCPKE